MTSSVRRTLTVGALAGLLLGWVLPVLLGPPVVAFGPTLRADPRLSDAITGAGGFLAYIAEAPTMYLAEHLTRPIPAAAALNALSWAAIGVCIAGFVVALRRRTVAAGALGGFLLGWMLPALAQVLGECFRHCWMHEGFLGTMALVGGTMLRGVGVLAELPWRLIAGPAEGVVPLLAIPVSAAAWTLAGMAIAAGIAAIGNAIPAPAAEGGGAGARNSERTQASGPDSTR